MNKKGSVQILFSPCTAPSKDLYRSLEGAVQVLGRSCTTCKLILLANEVISALKKLNQPYITN